MTEEILKTIEDGIKYEKENPFVRNRALGHIPKLITEIRRLWKENKELKIRAEVAESIAYEIGHPDKLPCGHSSQYCFTDNGGKTIRCLLCSEKYQSDTINELNTVLQEVVECVPMSFKDILSGWRYIQQIYGKLYGIAWDRCEKSATQSIAALDRLVVAMRKE